MFSSLIIFKREVKKKKKKKLQLISVSGGNKIIAEPAKEEYRIFRTISRSGVQVAPGQKSIIREKKTYTSRTGV